MNTILIKPVHQEEKEVVAGVTSKNALLLYCKYVHRAAKESATA